MKKILIVIFFVAGQKTLFAQYQGFVHSGEFGITVGAAHYFGDLNTSAAINRPKPAIGAFFRKQFNDYISIRISGHYAQLGYSDTYSKNEFQKRRNLSFNSNIWELALHGDFNFFKFNPIDPEHRFTPYVSIGVGIFNFDPYAYLNNQKYFLRPLGTEGQGVLPDKSTYNTMAFVVPFSVGVKYNISERTNVSFEIGYRFTNTDYLDDVSTVYAGENNFPDKSSPAYFLQDRSYETGDRIGIAGRQRGNSSQKDHYVIAEVGITFNLSSYRCPPMGRN